MVSTATRRRGSYHRLQQEYQIKSIHACMYVRTLLLTWRQLCTYIYTRIYYVKLLLLQLEVCTLIVRPLDRWFVHNIMQANRYYYITIMCLIPVSSIMQMGRFESVAVEAMQLAFKNWSKMSKLSLANKIKALAVFGKRHAQWTCVHRFPPLFSVGGFPSYPWVRVPPIIASASGTRCTINIWIIY